MSNDLLNILSNSNKDIDNQKLMDYLSGKLSQQEQHELEKEMAANDLMSDAVEGLEAIKSKQDIQHYVEQLNRDLQNQLEKKRAKRKKRRFKDDPTIYLAIVLVLALIIVAYIVLHRFYAS